jgi:hypothetical protein
VRDIAEKSMGICRSIFNKHSRWMPNTKYHLIDLTSGDMNEEAKTSPRIFLESLYKNNPMSFLACFMEGNKKTYRELRYNVSKWVESIDNELIRERFKRSVIVVNKRMETLTQDIKDDKNKYGLIYYDPNGIGGNEELEFITKYSISKPRMDVLLNLSAHTMKRCYFVNQFADKPYLKKILSEHLEDMQKDHWWIRAPRSSNDRWKWVMIFGTNNPNLRVPRYDFYHWKSMEGQHIIDSFDDFILDIKEPEEEAV